MTFPHGRLSAFSIPIRGGRRIYISGHAIKTGRIEKGNLPMTTSLFNVYAVPMALLASAGMAAPKAVAESSRFGRVTTGGVRYKPSAPAEQMYAGIPRDRRTRLQDSRPQIASLRKMDERCTKDLLETGAGQGIRLESNISASRLTESS